MLSMIIREARERHQELTLVWAKQIEERLDSTASGMMAKISR
jgi:hypothetical protein